LFALTSRLTPLPGFSHPGVSVSLKRDDELSFVAPGNKIRKLTAVIPWLKSQNVTACAILGGVQSNSVVSAASLLKEHGFKITCFVWGANHKIGNSFLLNLLLEPAELVTLNHIASEERTDFITQKMNHSYGAPSHWHALPEGFATPQGFEGAQSLAYDLLSQHQINKDSHIFIDAGTGLSAAALIKTLSVHPNSFAHIHVLALGSNFQNIQQNVLDWGISLEPQNWTVHQPEIGRSYGSTPRTILNFCTEFTRKHGVIVDPIYTGKLLHFCNTFLAKNKQIKHAIIIHGGGGHAVHGFPKLLK
jgi:1-aminocyclopropane-1-carboxylate deaminase